MSRTYFPVFAALLLSAVLAVPAGAGHSWANYHWARQTTEAEPSFDLLVVESVTLEWQGAFDTSLNLWRLSSKLDNVIDSGDENSKTRKRCKMVQGQMRVCNAKYGQAGWIGMATINIDANGHITQGTAKMNDSYDWYFAANPDEVNHVTCQEIGHVYGLGHTSTDGSSQGTCMDYSTSTNSQWPNGHDYEQLDTIYGHTDSYDTYDTAATPSEEGGGGGGDDGGSGCNAPPGKGCNKYEAPGGVPLGAVRVHYSPGRDGNLGHADYVLGDDEGGLWVFHLTLVPEDARRR